LEPAPFRTLDGDPEPLARAFWMRAEDGVRLRAAHWPATSGASHGAVLLFPGRTEYIEKYDRLARELGAAGFEILSLDWRGQGLSDRLIADYRPGHVGSFADYQRDVVELLVAAGELDLPRPWHLLAHSMGGAVGFAALQDGLPVASVAFSAPMFGLHLRHPLRLLAVVITAAARRLHWDERCALGSGGYEPLVLKTPFERNLLTSDGPNWARLVAEAAAWPELSIGGVTYRWLGEALAECVRLSRLPSPELPALIGLGSDEAVVSPDAIRARIAAWPGARLMVLPGARHEPLMERDSIRTPFLRAILDHFNAAGRRA